MGSASKSPHGAAWAGWVFGTALYLGSLWGCNLYAPLAADESGDLSYRGLILRGNEAINDRRYAVAVDYFDRARKMNPRGSEAYLYHSKAIISLYNIDYNELNTEFDCRRPGRDVALCASKGIDTMGIPFIDSLTTVTGIDSVYYPVATAVRNLEHILRKGKDTISLGGPWKMYPDGDTAADGRISDGVARLDLGLLQAVKAMLAPLDLDGNDRVDLACGRNFCPGMNPGCVAASPYKDKCKDGDSTEAKRLANFKKLTRKVSLDNLDSKDVNARNVSTNPNDINAFLDAMQGPVAGSNFNLDSVTGAMNSHGEDKMSQQLSGIVTNMNDLNSFLSYMRYNDSMDNDLDSRKGFGGRDEIMVWHDYDKDGGICYDYDERQDLRNRYPDGSWNIGHPIHRHLNKHLYQTFADWNRNHPAIESDTSKNSRKALMIKKCKDNVLSWPPAGSFTAGVQLQVLATCTTHSSLLQPSAQRPPRSDWVSGTPGVDEEMVDERDNDFDGLKDEDARNARGQDDDDDARVDTTMVGNPARVLPMIWAEAAGSLNRCPDITAGTMPAAPFQRRNCVGSLEHRIHLALTHGAGNEATRQAAEDTLATYYSRFTGTENGPHQNCLEDFEKLPEAYRRDVGLKVTDQAVRSACKFKHIWIRPIPAGSEWTSGLFGIDEEILDGVDNDGDGWIDEDLK